MQTPILDGASCRAGESCGLVKNLALMTHVTTDEEEGPIMREWSLHRLSTSQSCANSEHPRVDSAEVLHVWVQLPFYGCRRCALVFLNGNILGVHRRPKHFVRSFREMRRRGRVKEFVSVYMQHDTVHIASDGGRVCRPLIICDHGVPRVKEGHLQVMYRVQFWGALVCVSFLFFQTSSLFAAAAVVSGLIPFPHHNQSPRNTYQVPVDAGTRSIQRSV